MPYNPDVDTEVQFIEHFEALVDVMVRIEGRLSSIEKVLKNGAPPAAVAPTAAAKKATETRQAETKKSDLTIEGVVTQLDERGDWVKVTVDSGKRKVTGIASKYDTIKESLHEAYETSAMVRVSYSEKPSTKNPEYTDRYANKVEQIGAAADDRKAKHVEDDDEIF